ncbi:MAG: GreA/GreB family elongation factor [Candidatus Kapaibacterium sp.]
MLTKVRVLNKKAKKEATYQIVSAEDADFEGGKISVSSPIGKALMHHSIGDNVQVKVPAGVLEFTILEISR